ncbi:hypothetical protein DM02DRAFT_618079 [Periconia macrospinosa]|uniref:MYND-type domain-containing protein n=1 Tax=Periconia macrospinosa TaxID=97972 RepID=A0A2V1DAQ5_9PLEO|nr:hypothetical protein DM02DRAFT_618079 [Periconia macrospinosa]
MSLYTPDKCAGCKKTPSEAGVASLKTCAKCKSVWYCDRECQKADWKVHKKICSNSAAGQTAHKIDEGHMNAPPGKVLEKHVPNPFTRLDNGTYLHDRPEKDVYKLLIDCYRMRQEDDYKLEGEVANDSLYGGASTSIAPFRRFIRLAEKRPKLLPPWWNAEKKKECEAFGTKDKFSNLGYATEKQDVIDHYGNLKMPMQLRMLGEVVYGRGPGGQNGDGMRKMMVMMEKGEGPNMVSSFLSLNLR